MVIMPHDTECPGLPLKNNHLYLLAFVAGLVSLLVYLRALSCGFINFDDPAYVIENTAIRSLGAEFWQWSFGTIPLNYWTPLLWVSFALDYHFWGLNPLGYHLTNNLLHAVNVALFVLFAHRVCELGRGVANEQTSRVVYPAMLLFAALLFGLHPARVESVVWVTERKDVLNGLFTLGFLISYLRYLREQRTGAGRGGGGYYFLSLLLFILSMLIKPSTFLMPLALLVVDWYPLGRFEREKSWPLVREKIPFLLAGGIIVAISIVFRTKEGGFNSLASFPMAVRTVAAGNSLIEYLRLLLVPVNILPYEILPRAVPLFYIYKAIAAGLLLVATLVWARRFPAWAASVFFFVITIVPSLHFLTDGYQTELSPRYTYLPVLLPSLLAAVTLAAAGQRIAARWGRHGAGVVVACAAALLLAYGGITLRITDDWKNSGVFWTKVIENRPFDKAYYFRGNYLAEQGEYRSAVQDYTTCLELATPRTLPDIHNVYAFRGDALLKAGSPAEALEDFTTALSIYPHPLYLHLRGQALQALGRGGEATADFTAAGAEPGTLRWLQ